MPMTTSRTEPSGCGWNSTDVTVAATKAHHSPANPMRRSASDERNVVGGVVPTVVRSLRSRQAAASETASDLVGVGRLERPTSAV